MGTWATTTAVVAATAFMPWVVYLAGESYLTSQIGDLSTAWKQQQFMLEWWTIWFEFIIIILTLVFAARNKLIGASHYLTAWLAVNSALITWRATIRITEATMLNDGRGVGELCSVSRFCDLPAVDHDTALTITRLIAAGQVAVVFWNLMVTVFLGHAASACIDEDKH